MPLFESYDRRIKQINEALAKYGIGSIEEAEQLCLSKGINPREIVNGHRRRPSVLLHSRLRCG